MSGLISIGISVCALVVAIMSWRASIQSIRASIYDRRYEVYADAEKFIGNWIMHARPDMDELSTLMGAQSRSHFLFDEKITTYLLKVWLDAVAADYSSQIVAKEIEGDRPKALEKKQALLLEHADFDKLREVFLEELNIKS